MPGWLLPAATAAADFVGGLFTNRSSAKEAQRNRNFQERMSSTAAQRAVADYSAAGLNPALAYDRPASSPGGSQASFENPVSKAVSSAMSVANLRLVKAQAAKIESEKALIDTDVSLRTMTQDDQPTWRDEQMARRIASMRDMVQQGKLQPHQLKLAVTQAILADHSLSKAEAERKYYEMMGPVAFMVDNLAGPAFGALGAGVGGIALLKRAGSAKAGPSSAKSVAGMFKAPKPVREGDWQAYTRKLNARRRP